MTDYNSHADNKNYEDSPIVKLLKLIALIFGIVLSIVTIYNIMGEGKPPVVNINNKLALPIIVTVNDSYNKRLQAGEKQTITLLSSSEFPAKVIWKIERNKNNLGEPLGEEIGEEIKRVDKGARIIIDNEIGLATYFYPVIINNTDSKCTIVVNDGLNIENVVGVSSPHTMANITGYYKYATNSNITLECADKTYWRGERKGQQGPMIDMGIGSGMVEIPIP